MGMPGFGGPGRGPGRRPGGPGFGGRGPGGGPMFGGPGRRPPRGPGFGGPFGGPGRRHPFGGHRPPPPPRGCGCMTLMLGVLLTVVTAVLLVLFL